MLNILEDSKFGKCIESDNLYEEIGLAKNQYKRWCEGTLLGYGAENVDYYNFNTVLKLTATNPKKTIVYRLTVNYAKELCMLARTDNAKKIRLRLIDLDSKVQNNELFTDDQIVGMSLLKAFFTFTDNQKAITKKHINMYAKEHSNLPNPFAEFQKWRNTTLHIDKEELDNLIKQFCVENNKRLPKIISNFDKIRFLNEYDTLRNAVWDFLNIKGELNALKIANIVKRMAQVEGLVINDKNETNLFQSKKELPPMELMIEAKNLNQLSK